MVAFRLLICALALAGSTAAQAVVTWTIDILPEGVYYPSDVTFNGKRTVNASGISIWDVPLGTLGLPQEVIRPHYINDSGQVVSTVCESGNEPCVILALTTNGVMKQVPDPFGRPFINALSNAGQVLFGFADIQFISDGPVPQPPLYFDVPGYGSDNRVRVGLLADINDKGQILARVGFRDWETDGSDTWRSAVLTPVPEPHGLLLLACGMLVFLGFRLRRG